MTVDRKALIAELDRVLDGRSSDITTTSIRDALAEADAEIEQLMRNGAEITGAHFQLILDHNDVKVEIERLRAVLGNGAWALTGERTKEVLDNLHTYLASAALVGSLTAAAKPEGAEIERRAGGEVMETLGDALTKEIARVQDTVLPSYISLGSAGTFAVANLRAELFDACKALIEDDIVEMTIAYERLKEWKE